MSTSRKRLRAALLAGATLVVLAVALRWSLRPGAEGFATPGACVEAYRDGDATKYLNCLAEPLRAQEQNRYPDPKALAEALRQERQGVTGWVEKGRPEEHGDRAVVTLEEVRASGVRELRLYLERSAKGWLIARIDRGDERPAGIRYGTVVGEEPGSGK